MSNENAKEKSIVNLISIISSILGLFAIIIVSYIDLPFVFRVIMLISLSIITILSFYVVLGEQSIRLLKNAAKLRKQNVLTKKHFKEFKSFVERMDEFFIFNRIDNIPHVLYDLQNHSSEFRDIIPRVDELRELFYVFKNFSKKSPHNKKSFLLCLQWFESIFNIYNNIFVCKPIERAKQINNGNIPKHIRENYDEQKSRYVRFIEDYSLFAKKLNSEFGESIAREYFSMPKSL